MRTVPKLEKMIVDVQVYDLERAVSFYKDVLGLPLITQEKDWASFEAFGAEIHLYLHGGIEHNLEFRVQNLEGQIAVMEKLGVEFFVDEEQEDLEKIISGKIMKFPWGRAVLFGDSEGNELMLIED